MPAVRNFLSLKRWRLNVTDSLDPIEAIEEKVVVEAITADVMEVPREVDLVEAIITEKIPLVVTTLTRVAPTVMVEVAITREEAEEEGAVVDTKGAKANDGTEMTATKVAAAVAATKVRVQVLIRVAVRDAGSMVRKPLEAAAATVDGTNSAT
jgi:hypothetical protein